MSGPRRSPSISGIILTGFMGAGKTTVGALLAERLGWRFLDSDRVVEDRAGMTVAEIFARRGEAAFRELEAATIREVVRGDLLVLALGGGALESAATRSLLASLPSWRIVFLQAPFDILVSRCAGQPDAPVRPVLRDRERLAERWQSRLPWYAEAHLTVATADLTPQAVAESILETLFGAGDASLAHAGGGAQA